MLEKLKDTSESRSVSIMAGIDASFPSFCMSRLHEKFFIEEPNCSVALYRPSLMSDR
jgi:hypothetical protein